MGFDNEFDEDLDEDLDEELDEELEFDEDLEFDEELEELNTKLPSDELEVKTPEKKIISERKKISVYFMSTIGPGEKKQKLLINTGNKVGDIKETVANLFGLDPADFHLSSGGITMEETSFLKDYNINDGEDILLIPASTAG